MSKVTKIALAALVVGAGAYLGSTYYVGNQLNKNMPTMVADINTRFTELNIPLLVEINEVSTGFFSTSAVINLKSNDEILMSFDTTAKHGPFANFPSVGLASIEATLKDDKALQSLIGFSKSPMNVVLDGSIKFNGGMNLALAVSPVDKELFGGNLSSGNLSAVIVYEPKTSLNWQISTPEVTYTQETSVASDENANVKNSLKLDTFSIKGQLGLNETDSKPSAFLYSLNIGKGAITNSIQPRLSSEFTNMQLSANMLANKENDLLVDSGYQFKMDAFKIGEVGLDSIIFDSEITRIPKESLLVNSYFGTEMVYIPLMLKQSLAMNNEAILSFNPTFTVKSLNFANAGGKLTGATHWAFKPAVTDELRAQSLAGLSVQEMNFSLAADNQFLKTLFSQFSQTNLPMSEEDAKKSAEKIFTSFIELSQLYGGLLAVNDANITLNAEFKDNKGMLNGQELKNKRIYELLNQALSVL